MANSKRSGVLTGVGLAAAAAAAIAGAYYFYGSKEGPARRKKLKGSIVKMKGEVLERLEDLKEINQEIYDKTVDAVAEQYQKVKNITPEDIAEVTKELKSYWSKMQRELVAHSKKAATKAKRIARAVKKAAAE